MRASSCCAGLDLHEKVFGIRPQGVWPSEGSVSEEVLGIAHKLGVKWMATDEGVLGRSLGTFFARDGNGYLNADLAHRLYTIYRYENAGTEMNLLFRDHTLSDLIGFVYSGMPPQEAANNLMHKIRESAKPVVAWRTGRGGADHSWTARMRGNTIRAQAASSCGDSTTHCSVIRRIEAVTMTRGDRAAPNKGASQVACSGFVDQCELQCLDWRAGGQQGVGLSV